MLINVITVAIVSSIVSAGSSIEARVWGWHICRVDRVGYKEIVHLAELCMNYMGLFTWWRIWKNISWWNPTIITTVRCLISWRRSSMPLARGSRLVWWWIIRIR